MNDIPIVEDLLTLKILLYDIDIVDGNIIGELATRSVQKYKNTLRLLKYNNHICYVKNIDANYQSFRCPNCDTFFIRNFNLEPHLTTCSKRIKMSNRRTYIKLKNLCLTSWTLSEMKTLMSKIFSKTYLYSSLNPLACKKKGSNKPMQQNRLESIFQFRFPSLQIL